MNKPKTYLSITSVCISVLFAVGSVPAICAADGTVASADVVPAYSARETAPFKTLATEAIAALDAGKKDEMIAKLTDLETAWDEKEDVLSPKDPATWKVLDKTLDRGISALRSSKTDLPKGKAALQDLVKKLDRATKR